MNIDWSKAPKAVAAIVTKFKNSHYPKTVYASQFFKFGCMIRGIDCEGRPFSADDNYWDLVVRPEEPWNGEGFPPVGIACEAGILHVSGPNNENRSVIWIEGQVIAYHAIKDKTYAWFAEGDGFYPPGVYEFRPIRTPEQIAAEQYERDAEYLANILKIHEPDNALAQAKLVLDCGYRQQVNK